MSGRRRSLHARHFAYRRVTFTSALALLLVVAGLLAWTLSGAQPPTRAAQPRRGSSTATGAAFPMTVPPGYSLSDLRFNDDFAGTTLDASKWNTYITSDGANGVPWNSDHDGGSALEHPGLVGNLDYDLPSQISVDNGLTITALNEPTPGVLGTSPYTYSWRSGALSTYGKFEMLGGYVQIEAKMPSGAGMWPALWMLPGPGDPHGDSYEIDIFEGGFNVAGSNPLDNDSWHLTTPSGLYGSASSLGVNTSAGYHVYAVKWVPSQSITWYFDGRVVGTVTSAQGAPIPDEPMELIMNLAVANTSSSSYRSVAGPTTPSPSALHIRAVQVYG
jgi:beta-glucanase (GH16 family)